MTFPIKINDHPVSADTFSNNKWKETDYYLLSTNSEGIGCAYLVAIDKQVSDSANEALYYLLQRLPIEEEGWSEQYLADTTPQQLADFMLNCGYLRTDKGIDLSIETCWGNYKSILTWVQEEKDHEITKNGVPVTEIDFLEQHYIQSAACFADYWNNRQYFIETLTHWALFRWSTGA